jgi:hypothetical protein
MSIPWIYRVFCHAALTPGSRSRGGKGTEEVFGEAYCHDGVACSENLLRPRQFRSVNAYIPGLSPKGRGEIFKKAAKMELSPLTRRRIL